MRPAIVPIWLVPCVALLWACSGNDESAEGSAPTSARPAMETGPDAREAIRLALEHPDRLPDDLEVDARRKPAEVLVFFGVAPGMNVLDMFSGGGYYTEIISYVVGEGGAVRAHNNSPYLQFSKEELDKRFKAGRLVNVRPLRADNNELELPDNTYDMALLILAYHDVYYVDENNGWFRIDGPKMLAEIHGALKSGGVLGVVDHAAEAGAPTETGGTLHRIDPELARREIEAAGFVFDGESEVLRNPEDDRTKPMYEEQIRGNTDRFVYRFRKP